MSVMVALIAVLEFPGAQIASRSCPGSPPILA
jgi:hypothetical protein